MAALPIALTLSPCSKMVQAQQMRLTATNQLLTSIQINELLQHFEAETGLVANSSEDAEVEDDDG